MKTVILTGANGFVGRQAIIPLIERNYVVHAVSNTLPTVDLIFENVVWHQADLLNQDKTAKFCEKVKATHLLHFAWYVEHGEFWNSRENETWLDASVNLIEQFKTNGGERIVVSGTCAEYEWGVDKILSENKTPLKPNSIYGECKLELHKRLADFEISQAWGRIFFLFGEFEHPNRLISSVIKSLLNNEYADCSHGRQIRDLMYVADVADAFAALLDSDVQGVVNIGSGKERTIREVVLKTARLLGKSELVRFGKIQPSSVEPQSLVANTARLNGEVKWQEKNRKPFV